MNRIVTFIALILVACSPPNGGAPVLGQTAVSNTPQPRLLKSYYVVKRYSEHNQATIDDMTYRPGQGTGGLDALAVPGGNYRTYTGDSWLYLTLNRSARLTVVWTGNRPPSWLNSWQRSGNRYTKSFAAGRVVLGTIGGIANQPYTVLFAEANGSPSAAPTVPAGKTVPRANQPCPTWVHDQYVLKNGQRTWHQQIDPVYWCYFGHEHGSDPDTIAGNHAPRFNDMEAHEGFKVFTFSDGGYDWMMTLHMGSSGYGRVCNRFHTVNVLVVRASTGEIMADLEHMADFGIARNAHNFEHLKPPNCPGNATLTNTNGRRNIPLYNQSGYESWQTDFGDILPVTDNWVTSQDNPRSGCDAAPTCARVLRHEGNDGARRWFITPAYREGKRLTVDGTGTLSGEFYTDMYGSRVLSSTAPTAMRQYIRPGVRISIGADTKWFTTNPWTGLYENEQQAGQLFVRVNRNIENALRDPN